MKLQTRLLFLGFLAAAALAVWAAETGDIKGRVTDEQGQPLPGVTITAASPALQGARTILSAKDGSFQFALLPVGRYTLTYKLTGFNTLRQEGVVVRLGQTTSAMAALPLASIQKEITVTAEAPLIDKTSADTSYLIGAADLERLPAQNRTVVDAVKLTPGVTGVRTSTRKGTATEGLPSFRGQGEEGNNWIVDGLSVSGVRLKDAGIRLNYDSLEEVQVISDPFSPEFGSAYGGVINMVTKSGGNDFHGTFSLVFMNKALQASREAQLSIVSEPSYFSNGNWYFNLGGPIVKDRLWFFVSENYYVNTEETRAGTFDYLAVPSGTKTTRSNNLFGKLTWAAATGHTLSLTAMADRSLPQTGGTGLPEMLETKTTRDAFVRLNYKGILDASTYVEAGFGQVSRSVLTRPDSGDLGPSMYYIQDLARNVHNAYGNVADDEKRLDFSLKVTKFADTPTFGRHEMTAGFEYYRVSSDFGVEFSGRSEDLFPGNGFDAGTKYYFSSWRDGARTPTFFYEYGRFAFVNASRGIGLYFKDKVSFDRFTVMAGLRTQTQTNLDAGNKTLWSWGLGDFLSPRFSLTVDLTKDGVNVLKVAWGRFSDLITTMPLGFFNTGAGLTFRTYAWQGGSNPDAAQLHDPANWRFEVEQKLQSFQVAQGIQPDFQSRWLLEFDRRLGPDWAVKARIVRAQSSNLLEILAIFDPNTLYKFLYDNFEYKRRDYTGFEVEILGKIGRALYLNASYSHGVAKGTNPGQSEAGSWAQEEGSTNYLGMFGNHLYVPPLPELAALKQWADANLGGLGGRGVGDEGWYGPLPYSVDHDVKINVLAAGPLGLLAAGAFEFVSGYPWEKLGYVPFFGGYYSFPEGRGARTSPGHAYLDLSLEKQILLPLGGFLRDAALSLRFDVFNALNSQAPIAYVKENIPLFGQVWGRQAPRQARLSAKLTF
jgi:hypothetical protein